MNDDEGGYVDPLVRRALRQVNAPPQGRIRDVAAEMEPLISPYPKKARENARLVTEALRRFADSVRELGP